MALSRATMEEARVLAVRLRLGLAMLDDVESWAETAILADDGTNSELVDLCLAKKVGEPKSAAMLAKLGGPAQAGDLMRVLAAVDGGKASADDLRRLADNLDPVVREVDAAEGLPEALTPALRFAGDFWNARVQPDGAMPVVEDAMRDFLLSMKQEAKGAPALPTRGAGVSAIVVSYRTGPVLLDCLGALEQAADIREIVLVDNGNDDDMRRRIGEAQAKSRKLRVVGEGENRGFGAGVNLGVRNAAGDRLLIINPDAVLQPGSVLALEAARAGAGEPLVVGGRIFGADGREQRGGRRRRLTLASAAATYLPLGWLKPLHKGFVGINLNEERPPDGPIPVGAVSGALMYLSRPGFERLGGFDEGYFLHVEDLDLCRRAEAEGGSVIYTPFASALHHGATSDVPAVTVERHKAAGLGRYFRKFARTPGEKALAGLLAPVFGAVLVLRAWMRRS